MAGGAEPRRNPPSVFFDYAGPLRTVVISPAASTLTVNQVGAFAHCPGIARTAESNRI